MKTTNENRIRYPSVKKTKSGLTVSKIWYEDHTDTYLGMIYDSKIVWEKARWISARWNTKGEFIVWNQPRYDVKLPNK